jgi:hypothetical protein
VKLNPEKCVFGVPRACSSALSCQNAASNLISRRSDHYGNGANKKPEGHTTCHGRFAALSHFIARLGERSLPLYKLMKKSNHFTWTPEAQEAHDSLKNILRSPPILTALQKSQCSCISQRQPKWSARLWRSSEKSPRGPKRCNGQCTSLARYSPTLRRATPKCRNLCT